MDANKKKEPKKKKEQLKLESKKMGALPGQQIAIYSKVTEKEIETVVEELNPDLDSLGYRG